MLYSVIFVMIVPCTLSLVTPYWCHLIKYIPGIKNTYKFMGKNNLVSLQSQVFIAYWIWAKR